jgi:hypothetical protein
MEHRLEQVKSRTMAIGYVPDMSLGKNSHCVFRRSTAIADSEPALTKIVENKSSSMQPTACWVI